jgi:hypothetical protein
MDGETEQIILERCEVSQPNCWPCGNEFSGGALSLLLYYDHSPLFTSY